MKDKLAGFVLGAMFVGLVSWGALYVCAILYYKQSVEVRIDFAAQGIVLTKKEVRDLLCPSFHSVQRVYTFKCWGETNEMEKP